MDDFWAKVEASRKEHDAKYPDHREDEIFTCIDCYEMDIARTERERIIKLLNNDKSLHNTAFEPQTVGKDERFEYVELCVPFCPGCEAIALIKGEK